MTTTTNYGMTLLEASQAQKEVTINEALALIDAALKGAVLDKDLATPPGSPATGAAYLVAASPTGAWAGKAKSIAYYDQIWRFIAPQTGMRLWVIDEAVQYHYDGSAWQLSGAGGSTDGQAKAWVRFTVSGGTVTVTNSFNVSSVTRNGAGDFTVNFTTAFSSANYVATGIAGSNGIGTVRQSLNGAPTASAYRLDTLNNVGSAQTDPGVAHMVFFGS